MLTSATVSPEGGESTDTLSEKPESVGKEEEEEASWREEGRKQHAEREESVRRDAEKRGIKLHLFEICRSSRDEKGGFKMGKTTRRVAASRDSAWCRIAEKGRREKQEEREKRRRVYLYT